jgi:dUTPase
MQEVILDYNLVDDENLQPLYNTYLLQGVRLGCFLFLRSSIARQGLILTNAVGVIDFDYTQQITAMLHNLTDKDIHLNKADRIAQVIIIPTINYFSESNNVRVGGYGSTGK